jgi:1-pyrroline-5-carboxylate dehydrogenase
MDATLKVPAIVNEPVLGYTPGSDDRKRLVAEIDRLAGQVAEVPCVIGGERVTTGRLESVAMPHAHQHVVAKYHAGGKAEMQQAIAAAGAAKAEWAAMPWRARASIFLKAAEALATTKRMEINATTMLGQSKTCHQAEIDAVCETVDFFRYGVKYAAELYAQQPESAAGMWNMLQYRPLEGFVLSLTPFNFTAIAANLCVVPLLMGNTVVWKPSENQMLSAWTTMRVLEDAGLPPGVLNMVPGSGAELVPVALDSAELGGVNFTGSTEVFRSVWRAVAGNLDRYRSYPRLVGETGGKDFILAHPSADPDALVTAIVRGAFEFQGQKCSAASRAYVPESVWKKIKQQLVDTTSSLAMGDVRDFKNFLGAVIKKEAFERHGKAIAEARASSVAKVIAGGETDGKTGWFVRPTIIQAEDPQFRTMREELFGPIMTIHVYPDARWSETLELVDQTSPYGLTGAVFAQDRRAIEVAQAALVNAAGNFYVNDKPTGAVVGQQPFGGARASGTNDKAGAPMNLLRWVSPRTIKETLQPPTDHRYPYMG